MKYVKWTEIQTLSYFSETTENKWQMLIKPLKTVRKKWQWDLD